LIVRTFTTPILSIALTVPVLSACSIGQENGVIVYSGNPRPVCIDWAIISLGEYEISNNVWGKEDIHGYSQCIFRGIRTHSGTPTHMRWSWNWPNVGGRVKAYPSILYGRKPWNSYSTTPHLPQTIAQLHHLTVTYNAKTTSSGADNLLLESWITSTAKASPTDRIGELAIQLYQKNWPGQAGEFIKSVVIDGIPFDFYVDPKIRVPGDDHTWIYFGFVHKGKLSTQVKLDMMDFANYLVTEGYIDGSNYLASVELGNEVNHGKGETVLEHFSVRVESERTKTTH
jgi:Glycosyl hydrolase family 12